MRDMPSENAIDKSIEKVEHFDFKKEVFVLVEQQKENIITYLQSEEVQAKIAKYIDMHGPESVDTKKAFENALQSAIENIKKLKCKVARIKNNASIWIVLGHFDIDKNLITINDSYIDSSWNLSRYNAEVFAQNKEQILFTVVHELRHATRLDNHSASEDVIAHNFNRALGLKNVLTHGDRLHWQFLEMRMHDTKKEMEAQKVDVETIQKKLDEIRASSDFEKWMMRISTTNKYQSDVMQPFELYARVKELEAYMLSRKLDFTKENIVLLTKEVMSWKEGVFGWYEQLLIMCQWQEEWLVAILHDLVDSAMKSSQYKSVA